MAGWVVLRGVMAGIASLSGTLTRLTGGKPTADDSSTMIANLN